MLKMFLIFQKNFTLRCLFILKFSNSQVNDKFIYHKEIFSKTMEITTYVTCYVTSNIINIGPLSLVGNGFYTFFFIFFSSFYFFDWLPKSTEYHVVLSWWKKIEYWNNLPWDLSDDNICVIAREIMVVL